MASTSASHDIQPEESISQIGRGDGDSIVSCFKDRIEASTSTSSAFLSWFSSQMDLGDNFLVIQNDPVTLTRAKNILG